MRILYLPGYEIPFEADPVVNGGDLRYSLLVIESLLSAGHKVTVINRSKSSSKGLGEKLPGLTVLNYFGRLSKLGPTFDISLARARRVWEEIPLHDCLITNTPLTIELLRPTRIPLIYNASGLSDNLNFGIHAHDFLRKIFVKVVRDPLRRLTWRRAECVNTTSSKESDLLARLGASKEKIISIPSTSFRSREELLEGGGKFASGETNSLRLKVLVVGRYSPAKNQIAIYKELRQLKDKIHLVFVGTDHSHDKGYFRKFKNLVEDDKSIEFKVNVPESDLKNLYSGADVVLAMSTGYDPLPTVIYEALSFGRPVISSDHPTRSHFDHGNDGFLICTTDDFSSLRSLLLQFYEDRERLDRAKVSALEIAKEWTRDDLRDAYVDMLEGLTRGKEA